MHVKLLSVTAALALTSAGVLAAGSSATADSSSVVRVVGGGRDVALSRATVPAGRITFDVQTTAKDSQVELFTPIGSATLADLQTYLGEQFSPDPATAAQGTRDLVAHFDFAGLAEVGTGATARVTENLGPGTYYLADSSRANPGFTTLTVTGHRDGEDLPAASAWVRMTSADRFEVTGHLPASGTISVHNVSDTLHFMELVPVKAGTTDAQVQAYFDSGAQTRPSFVKAGPTGGTGLLSPGTRLTLGYSLPAGTYVMLCFIADDTTGMPHAAMGMHQVVVLK